MRTPVRRTNIDWRLQTAFFSLSALGAIAVGSVVYGESLFGIFALAALLIVTACTLASGFTFHSPFFLAVLLLFYTYGLEPFLSKEVFHREGASMTLLYVTVFVLCLLLGYRSRIAAAAGNRLPALPSRWGKYELGLIVFCLIVCSVVGWIVFLSYLGVGAVYLFQKSHQIRLEIAHTGGLYFIRHFLVWAGWAAFWLVAIDAFVGGRIGLAKKLLLAVWFLGLEVWMVQLGQRFYLIWPMIGFATLVSLTRKVVGIRQVVLIAPVILILSSFYQFYRNLSFFEQATLSAMADVLRHADLNVLWMGVSGELNKFETLRMVVAEFPSAGESWFYGRTILSLSVLLLPQSIFAWKPQYTDAYLTTMVAGERAGTSGLAFGVIAELYINLHIIGIALGALALGIVLKVGSTYIEDNRSNRSVLIWYINGGNIIAFVAVGGLYSVTSIEWLTFSVLNVGLVLILGSVGTGYRRYRVRSPKCSPARVNE